MFKTIKKLVGYSLLILSIGIVSFYFWGSSPNWPAEKYAQLQSYDFEPRANLATDSTLRLITYNIGYLSGMTNNEALERTEEMFKQHEAWASKALQQAQPHLIALQEVDYDAHRSFYINQMDKVAEACQTPYAAQAVNWDKEYVPFPYFPPSMHFGQIISGQAIISAFPIKSHQRIPLERPKSNAFYYDAFYIDRLLQTALIQWNDKQVMVMNVHLEAYDKQVRLAQSAYVLEEYRKYAQKYPVILLGDFNSAPLGDNTNTVSMFLNEEGLASAVPPEQFNQKSALTFPSDQPKEQIDYIFYTEKHFESVAWRMLLEAQTASDHLPLLWEAKWRLETN